MATGIRIGWRKLMTLAAAQITAPTMMTRRTTKHAVSAAHMVLRCQGVGYSFMSRFKRRTSNAQHPTSNDRGAGRTGLGGSAFDLRCSTFSLDLAHYVGLVLGKSLLILFLVPSTFSARFLRSEEHTSELQSLTNLVCRLLLEKKKN